MAYHWLYLSDIATNAMVISYRDTVLFAAKKYWTQLSTGHCSFSPSASAVKRNFFARKENQAFMTEQTAPTRSSSVQGYKIVASDGLQMSDSSRIAKGYESIFPQS
ncbi:Hypothetical protein NTJ_04041 [Nesidiocoris tenuis]|uniref:Uncharacterized protein n=1 Tax=Nesidiocoris tenuis TaxID=355587 RepID=A0ABN7AIY2_9HEMI|nr:Hypothetical protein NTJ_04041 [Nesidiocoris tenuis]